MKIDKAFLVCPFCNEFTDPKDVVIDRQCIRNEDNDEFMNNNTDEKDKVLICRSHDTIFAKCKCSSCNKEYITMFTLEVKPIESYNAENRSKLITMIKE